MDNNTLHILVPLGTAALGFVGGLLVPWAKWAVEKRRKLLDGRRDLVTKWRQLVSDAANHTKPDDGPSVTKAFLERHPDFYSLRPHLSPKTLHTLVVGHEIMYGSSIDAALQHIVDDIALIEQEWGLV